MNNIRISGNLLFKLRKISHNDKLTGEDLLKRENFEHFTNAIQNSASVMKKTLYWSVEIYLVWRALTCPEERRQILIPNGVSWRER